MKRDMDLIREFMLKIEEGQTIFTFLSDEVAAILGMTAETGLSTKEADHREHNFRLLIDEGFIEADANLSGTYSVQNVTWAGHDFLDAVRDPKIWEKTKSSALAAGGFTADLLKDLAKGFIRKKVEELTGVRL